MAKIIVYNNDTDRMETYYKDLSEAMPYNTNRTLTVNEFRGASNGEYKENAEPCTLCKRMIINAGIEKVFIRVSKTEHKKIEVSSWIENDDTLEDLED